MLPAEDRALIRHEWDLIRLFLQLRAYAALQRMTRRRLETANRLYGHLFVEELLEGADGWGPDLGLPPDLPCSGPGNHYLPSQARILGQQASVCMMLDGLRNLSKTVRARVRAYALIYGIRRARIAVQSAGGWHIAYMGSDPLADDKPKN